MKSSYIDSLAHTTWKCKYRIVFAPKYRRKEIENIGGTMPENLQKPEKSISKIEKEQLKRLKNIKKKLMLYE